MLEVSSLAILIGALVLDRLIGDPERVWKIVPHPVAGFGALIAIFDRHFNRQQDTGAARARAGTLVLALLLLFVAVIGRWLEIAFDWIGPVGMALEVVVVAIFLAQKSLADHVEQVQDGLRDGGIEGGRAAVSRIVGRDPETLDESGVARAAIESLAENASDGVIAPAFWYALFGLPGLLAYKLLNTADSMIGHRNARYLEFGRAAARLDDVANWIPARLTGLMILFATLTVKGFRQARRVVVVLFRDSGKHRSPNAGWPESAMAAAVGVALSGPRSYEGQMTEDPYLNVGGRHFVDGKDIATAIAVFWRTMSVFMVLVAVFAVLR